VLIIQDDAFNESRIQTILVLAISFNLELAEAPGNVFLSKKDTHLPKDSVVNVLQIVTLDRERFISREEKLKTKILNEVEKGIKLVIGLS
ncbi:MAG: type II toxin-antitoxin system PemK/MazF family toxin, partial [Leptospiraceae bacterium]|nr:type II toxin-antitoxin system PemK/MazF family toxin [Leptospiraceae bacterium]